MAEKNTGNCAVISNPEYAGLYGITPALDAEDADCLIIDDAPLVFDHFDRNGRRLLGNFNGAWQIFIRHTCCTVGQLADHTDWAVYFRDSDFK